MKITSAEFQRNAGLYQDAAQTEPVAITKDGRPYAVLMSAALFEVVVKGRVARRVEDLDDQTLRAIAEAEVSADHAALDALLEDWNP